MLERIIRIVVLPLAAILFAVLTGMLFLRLTGYPAVATFRDIIKLSFQDWYGFGQVLRATTLLVFTGLAVALAFHAGLFNIGVEGQLYIGALSVGIAGYYLKMLPAETAGHVPSICWILLLVLAAMIGGGLWAMIPGVLKATTGAHEVITTIMMNFIALAGINYLLRPAAGSYAAPGTLHTPSVPKFVRLPKLDTFMPQFSGSTAGVSLFIALGVAVAVFALLWYTRLGYALRAVGKNPVAARLGGIAPGRMTVIAMFMSGAIAGLVGVDFVLGYKGYFEKDFSAGLGFIGIAVALLANNHPIGILFTAFLFGVLNYGKVAASEHVPKDIIEILQAMIILGVVVGNKLLGRAMVSWQKRRATKQT